MKTRLFSILFLFGFTFSLFALGAKDSSSGKNEVVIYAYDSFVAEWGPGPEIIKRFEAKTGYKCTLISVGDAAQVLSKALIEKDSPQADVLLGIDSQLFEKAKSLDLLLSYKPKNADSFVDSALQFDDSWTLTPYDWSHFAIMFDSKSNVPPPTSIEDLVNPVYAKKIILLDPRTSTPGLGFVSWTLSVFGKNYPEYWKSLKSNILTMAPSWDTGYGLFTSGEAPLVISYTTSAAYHVEYDNTDRFKCLIFSEGHPFQVEGVGVVKGAKNITGAKAFVDFMITEEAQNILPLTQWMYPVNKSVKLPPCYDAAPKASKTLTTDTNALDEAVKTVMKILSK